MVLKKLKIYKIPLTSDIVITINLNCHTYIDRLEKEMKDYFLCIIACILLLCAGQLSAAETVLSDPDHVSTGFEYRGAADVRLGDSFRKDIFSFGGMIDIRNESRFNQKFLPNHNWRGFGFVYMEQPLLNELLSLTAGVEHESAHPTMGFNDGNDTAYDKVYDSTYRAMNLNSLLLRLNSISGTGYTLIIFGDAQFYFKSKNTPELPENDLTWSEGISCGLEFRYPVCENTELFFSGFNRYVFESREKVKGNIYHDSDSGVETRYEDYPLINAVNTFSLKTGIILKSFIPDRKLAVYCGFLYGNIFGFVDSREKRTVYSLGIEIYH